MNTVYTNTKDLSILIPARREQFLKNTVEDILKNRGAETEIIVGLDGEWSNPPLEQHPDVNVIYYPKSIGQRAITNRCASLAKGKYVCKMDAHVAIDKGWDAKMLEAFEKTGDNVVMVSIMRNLHAYDWKCPKCGKRTYQDKGNICPDCGAEMRKKMLWRGKRNPQSTSYCFDSKPQFKYFEDWKHRPQYIKNKEEKRLTNTLSLQGSCFMCTREKYLDLNLCDETLGSWGNQGIEVACKLWLSGGRVLVNHNTYYAHLFRTKVGVFGFPWPVSGRAQQKTKKNVRDLFWNNQWEKQIHPVSWLVRKFWPVPGWDDNDLEALKKSEVEA